MHLYTYLGEFLRVRCTRKFDRIGTSQLDSGKNIYSRVIVFSAIRHA